MPYSYPLQVDPNSPYPSGWGTVSSFSIGEFCLMWQHLHILCLLWVPSQGVLQPPFLILTTPFLFFENGFFLTPACLLLLLVGYWSSLLACSSPLVQPLCSCVTFSVCVHVCVCTCMHVCALMCFLSL